MKRLSSFFENEGEQRARSERKFYLAFGAVLALAGVLLLMFPIDAGYGLIVLLGGWILFIAVILSVLRPLLYRRGIADLVMGIIGAALFAMIGWAAGGVNINNIENYKFSICVLLIFAGIANTLVFARMMAIIGLPLLLFCAVADIAVALLMMVGFPDGRVPMIYWYLGMLLILNGLETISESYRLKLYLQDPEAASH